MLLRLLCLMSLLLMPHLAIADACTSSYVMMPNGGRMLCTTCCYDGICTTRCS
jgi:hypothetical protein